MIVKAIRNHHPVRLMSWSRLTATANPGMNKTTVFKVSRIASPPKSNWSSIVVTTEAKMENKVHHQYSDLLDLVLKSKYRRNPEETACVKFIYRN